MKSHLPTTDAQWSLLADCDRAPHGLVVLVGPMHATAVRLVSKSLLEYADHKEFHGKKRTTVRLTEGGRAALDGKRCQNCKHYEYHCPCSGCNHHDSSDALGGFDCDCEEFVPQAPTEKAS